MLNAQVMAEEFLSLGYHLVTGGTDNHMVVLDLTPGPSPVREGKTAEAALDHIGISTSKSTIPDDPNPPFRPSGLRIGTPPMTTRGMKEDDIRQVVRLMHEAFTHADDVEYLAGLRQQVIEMSRQFPVPSL